MSSLNIEELQSQLSYLQEKVANSKELMNKVREHKHNYAEDFGYVVSMPVKLLLNELINNPSAFSKEERESIVKKFAKSMEMRGTYECLGLAVENQLKKVKEDMVPSIKENADFYTSLIGKNCIFQDKWLVRKLQMALKMLDGLCEKLENIEHFKYGESEQFNLKAEIKKTFDDENNKLSVSGRQTIMFETCFGEFSDTMVDMNRESFRTYFLGNFIKNLHEHAFKGYDEAKYQEYPSLQKNRKRNIKDVLCEKILRRVRSDKLPDNEFNDSEPVFDKKVRISFQKDDSNRQRINLIIENNGKAFDGDVEDVFDNGYGSGTGIGLYSAKQFLEHYGATIKMFTNNEDEYKVGFLINLPIL